MKMDATQKRRMWKVAVVHFFMTWFVVWLMMHYTGWSGPAEREGWFEAWASFWSKAFFLFQPQLLLFGWMLSNWGAIGSISSELAMIVSVPLWSICFSWIFVMLDNWLNHFPLLGRKVF
jgi:hypothetical protein